MARNARLRPARRRIRLDFPAIEIVGALLTPDMVARIAAFDAQGQTEPGYGIKPGLKLRDEIARYYRIGEALFQRFQAARQPLAAEGFMRELLKECFGFDTLQPMPLLKLGEREFPLRHAALAGRVPIVIAPAGAEGAHRPGIDESLPQFGDGHRRRSATLLLQEYLNASSTALWGIAADGLTLRLMRDNASLTRPAWIEADLAEIFSGGLFADFSALWLLIHQSRFGAPTAAPSDCALEQWRERGRSEGVTARENLRDGFEAALKELGQGFMEHPGNDALRSTLAEDSLRAQAFFEELLRLVYRLIFLFAAEDRGLLHPPAADDKAKRIYAEGYAIGRLRERCMRRTAWDRHGDAWEGLKVSFKGLARGEPRLGLPALGGLFAPDALPNLGQARIENRRLLAAIFRLAWFHPEGQPLTKVNWRDMETEELGSVYESLLELTPRAEAATRSFRFDQEVQGNARKISGSYYTPDALVKLLLDSTLDPVLDAAELRNPQDPVAEILKLTILDPACGSGHFLLGAARRAATRIAQHRSAEGSAIAQADFQHALREVVAHCIYGVDRNPMAVELCKVALWIEALEPGKPLTFLDSHIRCGDSLIGVFDLSVLRDGIPDEAYKVLEGDDRDVANHYKAKNHREVAEREQIEGGLNLTRHRDLAGALAALGEMPEDTVEQIAAKQGRFGELTQKGAAAWTLERACDLWTSAFFVRKLRGGQFAGPDGLPRRGAEIIATSGTIWELLRGREPFGPLTGSVSGLSAHYRFFHWPLAFADIMARGGFNVVLGNPPWETMSPDYKEFFSTYDPSVRAMSPAEQKVATQQLLEHPAIAARWEEHCRDLYTVVHFIKSSGRYRLFAPGNLGKGDFNVYRMFVETALAATSAVAAQLVPEGLYNGANATAIRQELFEKFRLAKLGGFENTREIWFKRVDTRTKFCLYVAWKGGRTQDFVAGFRINTMDRLQSFGSGETLTIPVSVVAEFSPDAMAVMEFAAQSEIDVCAKMYARYPKFGTELEGLPHRHYMREVDMGTDRDLFSEGREGLPVFEGRMIDAYDYRAKGYVSGRGRSAVWDDLPFGSESKRIQPQWRILPARIPDKLTGRIDRYRIGFGDVASPTNQRGLIAALLPGGCVSGHSVPTIEFADADDAYLLLWLGVANSFAMDFLVRPKVSLHMAYTIMDSLPFPRDFNNTPASAKIAHRVGALCAVGPEMKSFRKAAVAAGILSAEDAVVDEPDRRAVVAAEIDVLVARDVYGLTKDEMLYILDPENILGKDCGIETFKALRNYEMRVFREYRTQRLIMEAWDRLGRI